MGITNSKPEKRSNALKLCKVRKRFIKQAIDLRYALAAAQVSYTQSLRNIGIALRRYAEAEVLVETSLSADDKTPSNSSYQSPSPSHIGINGSPNSPSAARISYMRSSGANNALTVRFNPMQSNLHVEEGEYSMPPPPPPLPELGSSWDYFDPNDESFSFVGQNDSNLHMDNDAKFSKNDLNLSGNGGGSTRLEGPTNGNGGGSTKLEGPTNGNGELGDVYCVGDERTEKIGRQSFGGEMANNASSVEKDGNICDEREDPSEFITHRAKDFLSSIKEIDNRFFRASESGKEVSRMLESSKIHVGYADARGASSSASIYLTSFREACCQCRSANVSDDQLVTKVITWKRTTSSRSSSSRNPMKDDNDGSGSDFIEEFSMISGSHSSTLERLYAWERKLYDEVKAIESIQKEYDRKCHQLHHQFAKDLSPQVIDKTRAAVKDLHSQIRVALQAVDSISKRIEKMREEELLPQVLELIQGLTRMWKAMLECHHSQYITISLAYHNNSSTVAPPGETQRQIINQLRDEVECFGLSFADWINNYTSYVESLNSWLQNCILHPPERHKSRRAFSPRRYVGPPIFVLFRDWSAGIKSLPSQEVSDAIRAFLSDLRHSVEHQVDNLQKNEGADYSNNKDGGNNEDSSWNVSCVQGSLTRVLDRLSKFSEASVRMYEDVWRKCDSARNAYDNYRVPPRAFSI